MTAESQQIAAGKEIVKQAPTVNQLKTYKTNTAYKLPQDIQDVVDILKANPDCSDLNLQKKLNDLQDKRGNKPKYRRLKQTELLNRDVSEVRSWMQEYVDRELAPLALVMHHKALKAKSKEEMELYKKKETFILSAEKLVFNVDESRRPKQAQTINIKQLQIAVANKVKE